MLQEKVRLAELAFYVVEFWCYGIFRWKRGNTEQYERKRKEKGRDVDRLCCALYVYVMGILRVYMVYKVYGLSLRESIQWRGTDVGIFCFI